jgi:hypothetical protein
MKTWTLTLLAVVLFILHQDLWLWSSATPLILGSLPIGLFYHVCFSIASSLLMWALVKWAWPAHLEKPRNLEAERAQPERNS